MHLARGRFGFECFDILNVVQTNVQKVLEGCIFRVKVNGGFAGFDEIDGQYSDVYMTVGISILPVPTTEKHWEELESRVRNLSGYVDHRHDELIFQVVVPPKSR